MELKSSGDRVVEAEKTAAMTLVSSNGQHVSKNSLPPIRQTLGYTISIKEQKNKGNAYTSIIIGRLSVTG